MVRLARRGITTVCLSRCERGMHMWVRPDSVSRESPMHVRPDVGRKDRMHRGHCRRLENPPRGSRSMYLSLSLSTGETKLASRSRTRRHRVDSSQHRAWRAIGRATRDLVQNYSGVGRLSSRTYDYNMSSGKNRRRNTQRNNYLPAGAWSFERRILLYKFGRGNCGCFFFAKFLLSCFFF